LNLGLRRNTIGKSMNALPVRDVVTSSPAPMEQMEGIIDKARPTHSSLPHEGFSARNESWTEVQRAVLAMFKRQQQSVQQITQLIDKVKELKESEIGTFIYDYYKNQLTTKGLRSARSSIEKHVDNGSNLLTELADYWDYFYQDLMPTLQLIFHPITTMVNYMNKDLKIRHVNLIGFRDHIVLKTELDVVLVQAKGENIPPAVTQMLLVLQGVCEDSPPNEQFMQLERLVACAVSPYLGFAGLYTEYARKPQVKARRISSVRKPSHVIHPSMTKLSTIIANDISIDPKVRRSSAPQSAAIRRNSENSGEERRKYNEEGLISSEATPSLPPLLGIRRKSESIREGRRESTVLPALTIFPQPEQEKFFSLPLPETPPPYSPPLPQSSPPPYGLIAECTKFMPSSMPSISLDPVREDLDSVRRCSDQLPTSADVSDDEFGGVYMGE